MKTKEDVRGIPTVFFYSHAEGFRWAWGNTSAGTRVV